MAWRPTRYLIEGELDNTTPGKVTGWMRFAGLKDEVTFDLNSNFHRDIRGAKVRLRGDGQPDDTEAARYLEGLSSRQAGNVGDMTDGLPPHGYGREPYFEWYGDENGRVVIELAPEQVKVIGMPIPACESDPISREEQSRNMAEFLGNLSDQAGVPALAIGSQEPIVSDPTFTHWVIELGKIVGEARSVKLAPDGMSFAYVRLFRLPECAEHGYIATKQLRAKNGSLHA